MDYLAYAKLCNYNPLTMLSSPLGRAGCAPIDAWVDHDNIRQMAVQTAFAPFILPAAAAFSGLEIAIDLIFRRDIGLRKVNNLIKLAKLNNTALPERNYDILWSLEAEASRHPYGEETVMLHSLCLSLWDDYTDRKNDGENNFFNMPKEKVDYLFKQLKVKEKYDLVNRALREGKTPLAVKVFGLRTL